MTPAPAPAPIPFAAAFRYWLKLGCISFGGPAGQIAMMHDELVERRRWISEGRFLHALNYCMVLPGPEAQQLATYIGWLMHGPWGGIMAGVLFVLPSLALLIALSWVYMAFGHLAIVAGVLYGIKPAVTAIVLSAAWRIGSRTLRNAWLWAIAVAAFLAIYAFDVPFPWIILTAGVIGYVGGQVSPPHFSTGGAHGAARRSGAPAIIDDDTPSPAWAVFSAVRLTPPVCGGIAISAAALGLLAAVQGSQSQPNNGRAKVQARPATPQAPMTAITPALNRNTATNAAVPMTSDTQSKPPANGAAAVACGQRTCHAKNRARLRITPTTAAVMPVSGAVNFRSP